MGAMTFYNFYKKNVLLTDNPLSDSLRKKNIIYMKLMAPHGTHGTPGVIP